MFEIIVSFWSVCVFLYETSLLRSSWSSLILDVKMSLNLCVFLLFCFIGCDSVFLEYSRIDIFASLELLLTFWLLRLVNLFRLQSFILLNVCVEIISLLSLEIPS